MFFFKKIFFYNRKYQRYKIKKIKNLSKFNIIYRNNKPENMRQASENTGLNANPKK